MIKEKKSTSKKDTGFTKNPGLNKYADKILFKEKVKMANHILKTIGVPKG